MGKNLMPTLNLKPTQQVVLKYYERLQTMTDHFGIESEGAIAPYFASLLRTCATQFKFTLVEQFAYKHKDSTLHFDGALLDEFSLRHGCWEAKDSKDDLEKEIQKKLEIGYPRDNIIFQSPTRAILYQDGQIAMDADLTLPGQLVDILKLFIEYIPPSYEQWGQAVEEFKNKVPELGEGLLKLIEEEKKNNKSFIRAFENFTQLVKESVNPNIDPKAVEEMLIQHILTERIFRTIFNNPDFTERNVIAKEIEKVVQALTSRSFSRSEFLKSLDRFYIAIETTAATISVYSEKQTFLNTVYEKFFQGYSIKAADIYGIVYTPQPIVNFMVNSVESILQTEFKRSLSDENVHIIDPFVGTGNFIINIMRKMRKSKLPQKYSNELHCNEVMLLPYYIASMNIEHAFFELSNQYKPFEGICLVDTFDSDRKQPSFFIDENYKRISKQNASKILVVIANPPYNAKQVNENDNNKNRKYEVLDSKIYTAFSKGSQAHNRNALGDPYVKAIFWASERVKTEGIVAYITNNSFIESYSFDGMRNYLENHFQRIYILDLGGNVRKNPKLSGDKNNVFGIQLGVSINIFVRKPSDSIQKAQIFYANLDEYWTKEEKYSFLDTSGDYKKVAYKRIIPDTRHNWIRVGLKKDFENLIPMSSSKIGDKKFNSIFLLQSNGVKTNRDNWMVNFNKLTLEQNTIRFIDFYNDQVNKWKYAPLEKEKESLIETDNKKISWSEGLKNYLERGISIKFDEEKIIDCLYRPFVKTNLYFDQILNERRYKIPLFISKRENNNQIICVNGIGINKPFYSIITSIIPDVQLTPNGHCFPFYSYDGKNGERKENISDWALNEFREHYKDEAISKWDIFYYIYGILHHPEYATKYSINLKKSLPKIPFCADFKNLSLFGKKLSNLHLNYEYQTEYPLEWLETPGKPLDWRVKKMRVSPDKTEIKYNDFLTLRGIPTETFEYKLGNRSALDWIIDQYQVKINKRSGIINDPNNPDNPQYIVHLIGKIITVSLETMKIIKSLPKLE
jgi:predicted helicase